MCAACIRSVLLYLKKRKKERNAEWKSGETSVKKWKLKFMSFKRHCLCVWACCIEMNGNREWCLCVCLCSVHTNTKCDKDQKVNIALIAWIYHCVTLRIDLLCSFISSHLRVYTTNRIPQLRSANCTNAKKPKAIAFIVWCERLCVRVFYIFLSM